MYITLEMISHIGYANLLPAKLIFKEVFYQLSIPPQQQGVIIQLIGICNYFSFEGGWIEVYFPERKLITIKIAGLSTEETL